MVTVEPTFWDKNFFLSISNVPIGTKIYSPIVAPGYSFHDNSFDRPNWYVLFFEKIIPEAYKGNLFFENERVDSASLYMGIIGMNFIPADIEKTAVLNEETYNYFLAREIKIGSPLAEMVSKDNIPNLDDPDYNPETPYNPDLPSINMCCSIYQLKNKNDNEEFSNLSKVVDLGLSGLLKIEDILVFISPANE